jgi:23S rRNA pseudouridine1911/1915/1917 synthase
MNQSNLASAQRLDQYVVSRKPGLSRSAAERLIEEGKVTVNSAAVTKAGYRVKQTDKIAIDYDPAAVRIPKINLPVIYEDKDCVVVNKPVGVLTHSKGEFNPEATVATWLNDRVEGMEGERAGIVHRLDRATSGVMICAKRPEALAWLQKQFSERKVKKTYQTVVNGVLAEEHAIIDMPIERNPRQPQTFRVGANGKSAVTEYQVLATNGSYSLLELRPTTGRTHQLRVHLQHLGHPIIGDTLYGGSAAERLFLHAESLEITLPNRKRQTFEVPAPKQFKEQVS